jgi:hypothetical protein
MEVKRDLSVSFYEWYNTWAPLAGFIFHSSVIHAGILISRSDEKIHKLWGFHHPTLQ